MNLFNRLFQKKPVIGMLHLGGRYPLDQALQDLKIYEQEGLDGVIVGSYFKPNGNTELPVQELNVRRYIIEANKARS